jgi:hypothetical protein
MIDSIHLRDLAGKVSGYCDLSLYDAHQINLTVCAPDGDAVLLACDLSAASARKLALALLQAADDCEGDAA